MAESSKNGKYVDAVARTMFGWRWRISPAELILEIGKERDIKVVGAMYHLSTGWWSFWPTPFAAKIRGLKL